MSSFFQPGQELDENGLKVFFHDRDGNPLSNLIVRYSIYKYCCSTCSWITVPPEYHQDATAGPAPGQYYAQWDIPHGTPTGYYQIRWDFKAVATDLWAQRRLDFQIVSIPHGTARTAEVSDLPGTPIVIVL